MAALLALLVALAGAGAAVSNDLMSGGPPGAAATDDMSGSGPPG